MAWLQNLAGHAENLLNKIDQNAATVLNDGTKSITLTDLEDRNEYSIDVDVTVEPDVSNATNLEKVETDLSVNSTELTGNLLDVDVEQGSNITESNKPGNSNDDNTVGKNKSDHSSVSSSSVHNSFLEIQEIDNLHTKIARLEFDNQELNKQLLNVQCLYSEIRNNNANLQSQIERLNEQLTQTQTEKEQYVVRAQRILQEKEKLLLLNQTSSVKDNENKYVTYNEELRREVEFLQEKVKELSDKNAKLLEDMQSLQIQNQVIHNGLSQSNQLLEHSLLTEKKNRALAEEDCIQKSDELQLRYQEILQLQDLLKNKNEENAKLKDTLSQISRPPRNDEYEHRIKSLTQTLIFKQNSLETATTERNALRIQFEKLQVEHEKKISELKMDKVKVINIHDTGDEIHMCSYVPQFMRVTPHDAGVTRRMKHAYSSLDALSIKTGVFLRRYPVARVFVFCYVVILHIWVLTVLLWYVPSNQ